MNTFDDKFPALVSFFSTVTNFTEDNTFASNQTQEKFVSKVAFYKDLFIYELTHRVITNGNVNCNVKYDVVSLSLYKNTLLVLGNQFVELFSCSTDFITPLSGFPINSDMAIISNDMIFDIIGNSLETRSLNGEIKKTQTVSGVDNIIKMINNNNIVVLVSDTYKVFVYDIAKKSPKLLSSSMFQCNYQKFRMIDTQCSCNGQYVVFAVEYMEDNQWIRADHLYVHCTRSDRNIAISVDRKFGGFYFDSDYPRLLILDVKPKDTSSRSSIVLYIFNDDLEYINLDEVDLVNDTYELCGIFGTCCYTRVGFGSPQKIELPFFSYIRGCSKETREIVLNCIYFIVFDNNEIFSLIEKSLSKEELELVAKYAIHFHKTEISCACLGKLMEPMTVVLKKHKNDEFVVEILSLIYLGEYDKARDLVDAAKRYDVLSNILMATFQYDAAVDVARFNDRIQFKGVCYRAARKLEVSGRLSECIKFYEMSGCLADEISRIALRIGNPGIVFDYLRTRSLSELDPKILIWCGSFCEAQNDFSKALEYFEMASSIKEVVRLLCVSGKWKEAKQRAINSGKQSVLCLYARLLIKRIDYLEHESKEKNEEAGEMKREVIQMFQTARQFGSALQYALNQQMIDEILTLSYSAPSALLVKAGEWFSAMQMTREAILMFSRAGKMAKALHLCFQHKRYDALDDISEYLNIHTDSRVLIQCSHYFAEGNRWSKAAQCLALAKKFDDVLEICNTHNVRLEPKVLRELSDINMEKNIAEKLSLLCERQGQYQYASKIYVKLKDFISAIKSLIRAGDTERVIKLAKVMKKREAYILAANYLISLSPKYEDNTYNTIVHMYQKADAIDKLYRFYESYAYNLIDDYQNYDLAEVVLEKSYATLLEAKDVKNKDKILSSLGAKLKLLSSFVTARKCIAENTNESISICVKLLKTSGIEDIIRPDDIYIVLVRTYVVKNNFKAAYKILEDMSSNGSDISTLIDEETRDRIYQAVGKTYIKNTKEESADDVILDLDEKIDLD